MWFIYRVLFDFVGSFERGTAAGAVRGTLAVSNQVTWVPYAIDKS